MKKLILFFLLLAGVAYGQTPNATNTKFTNGLAVPNGVTQKPTSGLTAGALSYVTGAGLYVYNGSAWVLLGLSSGGVTSFNARTGVVVPEIGDYSSFYVPLTRSLTINGATQTLAADRTWTITANTPNSLSTGYGLTGGVFDGSVARTYAADTLSVNGLVSKLRLATNLTGYVKKATTITINGVTQDLSDNRTWTAGTVTNVSALTLGTTGTDLSSSVATGTTTPVITLNVPTASAINRGALSSTDWTTFNNKQDAFPGLQDSLTKKANRTFDNVASGAIANVKLANSTISGVALGSNLNALTLGNGLIGTSYNGSSAVTARVDTTAIQTVSNFFPKGDTRWAKSVTVQDSLNTRVKKTGDTMTGTLNGTDIVLSGDLDAENINATDGITASGVIGSSIGHARADATVQLYDTLFPFLVGYFDSSNINAEFGIAGYGKDSGGDSVKLGSMNFKFYDDSANNHIGTGRYNMSSKVSGVLADHTLYRGWGNGTYGSMRFLGDDPALPNDGVLDLQGNQTVVRGSGATARGQRFVVADFGVDEFTTTARMNVGFTDFFNTKGILFGYDLYSKTGIIASLGSSSNLSFRTSIGATSAERFYADSLGNFGITGNYKMPAIADMYAGTKRIASWDTNLFLGDVDNGFSSTILRAGGTNIITLSNTGESNFAGDIILANGFPIRGTNTAASNRRLISIESDDKVHIAQSNDDVVFGTGAISMPGVVTLGNGSLSTTQTAGDNSTKVATTAYVDRLGGGTVTSGTYTPTLTNTSGIASSTAGTGSYQRIGNQVSGFVDFSATGTSEGVSGVFGVSLPIASNFSSATNVWGGYGVARSGETIAPLEEVSADTTNDRFIVKATLSDLAARTIRINFNYTIQ